MFVLSSPPLFLFLHDLRHEIAHLFGGAFLHLHSRHTADAGKHGGKDGEFHGAGDVKTKEKTCENLSTFAGFWS